MNNNADPFSDVARTVIDAAVASELIAPLRAGIESIDPHTVFARICWSGVCEPGDRAAGAVIEAVGPEVIYPLLAGMDVSPLFAELNLAEEIDWRAALGRWQPRLQRDRLVSACRHAAQLGACVLVPGDAHWPAQLADLGWSAPHALWVRGQLDALDACARSVALVGARAASPYGSQIAADLAAGLTDREFAIVSGGAYGIDAAAHRSTLASDGRTVAVLAGGVDRLYPAANRGLFDRVMRDGAVLSELIVGRAPERWRFVQRNRLIAALSQVTCVVEAGPRSGALHTARGALELGRGVGAVPGPVTAAGSVGCHNLVRDSLAQLVTSAAEVHELWREQRGVGWSEPPELPRSFATDTRGRTHIAGGPTDSDRRGDAGDAVQTAGATRRRSTGAVRVRDALRPRARRSPEQLAEHAGMSAAEVRAALTELEIAGDAVREPDGWRRTS